MQKNKVHASSSIQDKLCTLKLKEIQKYYTFHNLNLGDKKEASHMRATPSYPY
jgi:hypothetical protein